MSVAFDTLKFARALRDKASMSAEQAEGVADAFSGATTEQLATKSDLFELGASLRADISELRGSLRAEISGAKSELRSDIARLEANDLLVKWMLGFLLASVVAVLFLQLRH